MIKNYLEIVASLLSGEIHVPWKLASVTSVCELHPSASVPVRLPGAGARSLSSLSANGSMNIKFSSSVPGPADGQL